MLIETSARHTKKPPADPPPRKEAPGAIEAHSLRKVYPAGSGAQAREALKSIDLHIPRGTIYGFLGPNGAGKSTFINILAGLTLKTSGRISAWGFDIEENPRQLRASVGVVPQELQIDPFFTPREILELQAGLYGVAHRDRRTDEILARLHLKDHADAYARTLSGGMRRRLMIAKAMVHNPPVLVLDEPTAGVDVELRHQLWEHIRALNVQGTTVVLTTHYLEEAQGLCERIAIVDEGRIIAEGTTGELLQMIEVKSLIITPTEALKSVPAALKDAPAASKDAPTALEGVEASLEADGRLHMRYSPARVDAGAILAALSAAGVGVREMETREPALEDVFLRLTHHEDEG